MHNSLKLFNQTINEAKNLSVIYQYLNNSVGSTGLIFDDLLRSQIVYSVGALDKYIHDIVRIGVLEIFLGNRAETQKYKVEPISLDLHVKLNSNPPEVQAFLFENAFAQKLKYLSYQDPEKISDALSYIWSENQKWKLISTQMGKPEADVKTTLKLIVARRNSIAHESDFDPTTRNKTSITVVEANFMTNFIQSLGHAIHHLNIASS